MNEQIKAIIDRARVLLAAATPGPVTVYPHPRPSEGFDESRFQWGDLTTWGRSVWTGIPMVDAEVSAFAVNNLTTLCDALEASAARIAELEADGPAACEEALRQAIEAEIEFITSDPIKDSLQRALDSVSVSEASLRLLEDQVAKDKRIAELEGENAILRARIGPEHFECPDCGAHAKADDDGCCATCGADCEVCRCDCNVRPSSAQA